MFGLVLSLAGELKDLFTFGMWVRALTGMLNELVSPFLNFKVRKIREMFGAAIWAPFSFLGSACGVGRTCNGTVFGFLTWFALLCSALLCLTFEIYFL